MPIETANLLELASANLFSAPVLFFLLGFVATLLGAQLALPSGAAKMLAVYLMLAIGFKGGVALAGSGIDGEIGLLFVAGILFSALMPLAGTRLLKRLTALGTIDRAAIAAHYGSISIVTFVAASTALKSVGIAYDGAMVAVAAAMETPAILTALLVVEKARRGNPQSPEIRRHGMGALLQDVFLNATIVVLLGSFAIGAITGEAGNRELAAFVVDPFKGALCLFLLDLGSQAAAGLRGSRRDVGPGLLVFAVAMPALGAAAAGVLIWILGISAGNGALFMVLAASASYIAVPAAMRLAVPEARPALSLGLALGMTFPFNIVLGIPLYIAFAEWLAG
jgi:hypothetical protein